jgi:hypothetical protein
MFTLRDKGSLAPQGKAAPTAAHAFCPCHTDERRTGLIYSGEHLMWRVHYVKLGRSAVPCRASGVVICHPDGRPTDGVMRIPLDKHRATDDNGIRPARCRHERSSGVPS